MHAKNATFLSWELNVDGWRPPDLPEGWPPPRYINIHRKIEDLLNPPGLAELESVSSIGSEELRILVQRYQELEQMYDVPSPAGRGAAGTSDAVWGDAASLDGGDYQEVSPYGYQAPPRLGRRARQHKDVAEHAVFSRGAALVSRGTVMELSMQDGDACHDCKCSVAVVTCVTCAPPDADANEDAAVTSVGVRLCGQCDEQRHLVWNDTYHERWAVLPGATVPVQLPRNQFMGMHGDGSRVTYFAREARVPRAYPATGVTRASC
jgi:hypothetical protein